MCGIVAYIGKQEAYPILIKGLKRLEYRGYDSAGISLVNSELKVFKCKGKVADLEAFVEGKDISGSIGIGHTRWATHGEPNDVNAHPHYSGNEQLAIIHNGIIENYDSLKKELIQRGHVFKSDTDTEVLIHLIEDIQTNENLPLSEAVRVALTQVVGAYAIAVLDKNDPNVIIGAKKGSPMVVGIGKDKSEFFLASDATPIIEYTKEVVYLDDEQIVELRVGKDPILRSIENEVLTPYIQELELHLEALEKGGYEHFMLKEIFEQPKSISDSMRGRYHIDSGTVTLGGIIDYEQKIANAKRIIIVACGTSWHAGLVGEYLIEDLARIPVEVEYASEFRYRNPIIGEEDVVIAISQSGETADTLAALELAKSKGATIIGICNVVGSSISRITHGGSYTHAGPEIGVASTKAFTSQVTVLLLMALRLAHKRGSIAESRFRQILASLEKIPAQVEEVLQSAELVKYISGQYKDARNFLYLGRGYSFPVALEGALKLKEISYIHAEGYPAGELKHGPLALVDDDMPVIAVAPNNQLLEKLQSNLQEVRARGGELFVFADTEAPFPADQGVTVIGIPKVPNIVAPIVYVVPLQLLSYHVAVLKGTDVDQPRNLAKSVTVE